MNLSPLRLGAVFCGWGVLVAIFAIFGAPWFRQRFGTPTTLYGSFALMGILSAVIGIWPGDKSTVIAATIASGVVIGMNNTLVTTAVMSIAPVPRPVASATYGFVRFIGGGLAPFAAGKLVEHYNVHVPFLLGAGTVVAGALVLATVHCPLAAADDEARQAVSHERADAEAAVAEVPGLPDEAILAEEALTEDRAYGAR
jgi:MFS family permease